MIGTVEFSIMGCDSCNRCFSGNNSDMNFLDDSIMIKQAVAKGWVLEVDEETEVTHHYCPSCKLKENKE